MGCSIGSTCSQEYEAISGRSTCWPQQAQMSSGRACWIAARYVSASRLSASRGGGCTARGCCDVRLRAPVACRRQDEWRVKCRTEGSMHVAGRRGL